MTRYYLLLITILLAGCSKKGDPAGAEPAEYYLRFKAEGLQQEYRQVTSAHLYYDAENLAYHCNLTAALDISAPTRNILSLFLVNKEQYKTGIVYHLRNGIHMPKTNAVMPQVMISLLNENGKPYTAQLLPASWYQFDDMAEVRFSEITDKHVRGYFSGLAFTAMPERTPMKITDGEFYLSVIR
ncbi:hypothetical protein [Chitinophaga alhagiae]|uniref:hypothetical protein n=1 Tax=Chitinophaga alhagiae TaxID=2203219 RepID=UPI0013003EEB|nr:hypothetical protein [Chitinophaga alhagiae]